MTLVTLIGKKFTCCNPSFNNLSGFLDDEFSDVTITVNHDVSINKSYKLHRNVLAGCSSVLHKSLAHQKTLKITHMSPDEFELLIIFMYTGDVRFHSVAELCSGLYAANVYKINTLVDKCTERLLAKLVEDCANALEILKLDERFNSRYNNSSLFKMVDETIQKNYKTIISSDGIKDLEYETMKHLLQMNTISKVPEIEVFNSLLRWTTIRCNRSEPPKKLQDVAGDLIFHIRYKSIPYKMLGKIVASSGLLPAELMVRVFQRKSVSLNVPFCTQPRQMLHKTSPSASFDYTEGHSKSASRKQYRQDHEAQLFKDRVKHDPVALREEPRIFQNRSERLRKTMDERVTYFGQQQATQTAQIMQIFVITPRGKTIIINVEANDTIYDVKTKIEKKENIPPDMQRLVFGSKQLEDGLRLNDYYIKMGSNIFLHVRLGG